MTTTISASVTSITSGAAATPARPTDKNTGQAGILTPKPVQLSAEQKAEITPRQANPDAVVAASQKRVAEINSSLSVEGMESHQMYLSNVAGMSLDSAKKTLSLTQTMIDSKEDAGLTVNGAYGDKQISDLPSYKAALVEYIGKYESAVSNAPVAGAAPPSQASTAAVSNYLATPGAQPDAPALRPRAIYFVTGKSENYLGKPFIPTGEIKAEIDRARAASRAWEAQNPEIMASIAEYNAAKAKENRPVYYALPNIDGMTLGGAKNVMETAELMLKSDKVAATPFKGHYGDQEITDLGAYKALLTDYISKYQGAASKPAAAATVPFQTGTSASSTYRQVRDLVDTAGNAR